MCAVRDQGFSAKSGILTEAVVIAVYVLDMASNLRDDIVIKLGTNATLPNAASSVTPPAVFQCGRQRQGGQEIVSTDSGIVT